MSRKSAPVICPGFNSSFSTHHPSLPLTMAQLILIRHGETLWNTERRMQGQLDSPLTERGLWQARQLGERLKSLPFVSLYSSDLPRARQTAQRIADVTGHQIIDDLRLRERHFGLFEG